MFEMFAESSECNNTIFYNSQTSGFRVEPTRIVRVWSKISLKTLRVMKLFATNLFYKHTKSIIRYLSVSLYYTVNRFNA